MPTQESVVLVNWNGIVNNTIHPGQRLLVKNIAVQSNTTTAPISTVPQSRFPVFTANHHLVRPGETIQGLAQKYGITTQQFISWNNIVDNTIHPGQRVLIKNENATSTAIVASPVTANDYIVRPGDSVWRITNNHGISMQDFISWNNIKNNTIHPNQRVIVKNPATIIQTDAEVGYIVKAGDSVWRIANLFGMSMDTLVKLNQIVNYTIHPGQRLVIQQARSSSNSASQSSQSASSSGTTNGSPKKDEDEDDEKWSLSKTGAIINGREYTRHALERMAPNIEEVRRELQSRAEEIALKQKIDKNHDDYIGFIKKYVQPRNIPPSVVEHTIRMGNKIQGRTPDVWVHRYDGVEVIVNNLGDVISVHRISREN